MAKCALLESLLRVVFFYCGPRVRRLARGSISCEHLLVVSVLSIHVEIQGH